MEQPDIRRALADADDIRYMLWSTSAQPRFPRSGWLTGSIANVATAIRIGSAPISEIEVAAKSLEDGIERAATRVKPAVGEKIAAILHQKDGEQTRRMGMLILCNALIFQDSLADKLDVLSLSQMMPEDGRVDSDTVLVAWKTIQDYNYHPIFDVAIKLLRDALATDSHQVGKVLRILRNTAKVLVERGLANAHELSGIVFQNLIVDRKFIKANYTRPESAALLNALVISDCPRDIRDVKVADFACGTGALLNGAYQRLLALHEQAGGDGKTVHRHMLENNLVGCDIMPNAVHLTAALIIGTHPHIKVEETRIHCMPYGTERPDGLHNIGSLDLLSNPEGTLPLEMTLTRRAGGHGDTQAAAPQEFRHGEFDFVVQNPPYTRGSANNNADEPITMFGDRAPAAAEMRRSLRAQKSALSGNNVGFGPYFVDLADRMLKSNGRMGIVLPVTTIFSSSWLKVRDLWARKYHDVIVVTIADAESENCAFSADTNMAECLIIATKGERANTGRGIFVSLYRRPSGELEALAIADEIHRLKDIRKLEDGPISGNPIRIGDEIVGAALNSPLMSLNAAWPVSRIKDMTVVQLAYELANGKLWLPRQLEPLGMPICRLGEIGTVGFVSADIHGGGRRGAFDIEMGCPDTIDYPCLWHVNSNTQRAMLVEPDSHALPRPSAASKIRTILKRIGRVHYNLYLRFTSNALAVMFTEQDSIGVNLIPNIVFEERRYDYVWTLWCNSTLGLLCHWMHSGKQQAGRGISSRTTLKTMPTLDVRKLTEAQLATAERIFHELKEVKMLPFNEMHRDAARHTLDGRLLSEVLGFGEDTHPAVHTGIALLREKLSAEPSIAGTKLGNP